MPSDPRDLHRTAILLDVDGTLLDIAPTPHAVEVPASLRAALAAVSKRVGGALALVSGRPLADLDRIFAPLRLPAIGGHGAEMRLTADGATIGRRAEPLDPALVAALNGIAGRYAGVVVEDKGYSVALHYRLVPKVGKDIAREVREACSRAAGQVEVLAGKAVLEIKGAGFNKGSAVRELMAHPPFQGRRPIFIGDDKTDEHAFAVMPEFDGRPITVGRRVDGVEEHFESPAEVREWLERLAERAVAST